MILGGGLLARAFAPRFAARPDVMVFASGVSNSFETSLEAFARERDTLVAATDGYAGKVIYFGSCSVDDGDRRATPYVHHKLEMEALVLARPGGLVLRLPQVVGRTTNPHTLTNFLHGKIMRGEAFCVWGNAERNLVDVDDVAEIGAVAIERLPAQASRILYIAARRSVPMPQLVAAFERVLGRKARYRVEPRGAGLAIDAIEAGEIATELGIDLGDDYVERILRKYYGDDA